jgi:hypothetical protein
VRGSGRGERHRQDEADRLDDEGEGAQELLDDEAAQHHLELVDARACGRAGRGVRVEGMTRDGEGEGVFQWACKCSKTIRASAWRRSPVTLHERTDEALFGLS